MTRHLASLSVLANNRFSLGHSDSPAPSGARLYGAALQENTEADEPEYSTTDGTQVARYILNNNLS